LNFRLEEIDGQPQAVFEDIDDDGKILLPHFLHPAPHFVPDVLYELSLVERRAIESSGFETDLIEVQFFRDRVVVKSRIRIAEGSEFVGFVLSLDEAKLLLLEWGAKVQRWRMEKETGEQP
jgi:hypothetical protein